jgi:hypothetical protein
MTKLSQPIAAIITSQDLDTSAAICGQITVTTAGTEVQGGNVALDNGVYIRALTGNTGVVYVGNDGAGAVSASTGYQLNKGEAVTIHVANLNQLWFDAATNGDKFCWLKA